LHSCREHYAGVRADACVMVVAVRGKMRGAMIHPIVASPVFFRLAPRAVSAGRLPCRIW